MSHVEYVARKNDHSDTLPDWRVTQKDLPPLGARVSQGPDLTEDERSSTSEEGTVLQHHSETGNV